MCKKTHERTHRTLLWACLVAIPTSVAVACLLPSQVEEREATTEKEKLAVGYVECHAREHGLPFVPAVRFVNATRVDGALAWGSVQSRTVTIVRAALETWIPVEIELVCGHEVAHTAGIFDEDEATRWADQVYKSGACH